MKRNLIALLLASAASAAFAQATNPFMPPKQVESAPGPSLSPAALAGMPMNSAGRPIGPDGRPLAVPGAAGQPLPPVVPPFGSEPAAEPKQEIRVRYVGKANGQNVYKADAQYHFDKRQRPSVDLVEGGDAPPAPPSGATPAASPR